MRRALGAFLATAAAATALALVLAVLFIASGLAGRLVREVALSRLARVVDGTVRVAEVGGSLWRSVVLRDVEFADPAGRTVLAATRVEASYHLLDLLRGRFILRNVLLARPTVRLEQDASGRWNVARLFRVGAGDTVARRRPLVDLRDARVTDGTLTVRTAGARRAVRFSGVTLDLRRLRASHPDSAALIAEVRDVAFRLADPALRVTRGWGDVVVGGDSVKLALDRVELPGSAFTLQGVLHGGGAHPAFAVSAGVARLAFADVASLSPRVPASGGGRFRLQARGNPDGSGVIEVRDAELRSGESHVSGTARVAYDARGAVRVEAMDVVAAPLDLALVVPSDMARPPRGTVRGRLRGAGTPDALDVVVDGSFTDEVAAGRPVSTIVGRGGLRLGGPEGLVFRRFAVRPADVALVTVARFAPAVNLRGRVRADGELDGAWTDATFTGALAHHDGAGAVSRARGRVRLTLADTVHLAADLELDSLAFDGLVNSYPGLPLRGAVAGRVRLEGPITGLRVEANLSGPAGRLDGTGVIAVADSAVGVRATGRFAALDLAAHGARLPPSSLEGTVTADLVVPTVDSLAPTTGSLGIVLGPSKLAGVALSRAGLALRLDAGAIRVDSLTATFPSGALAVTGALGRAGRSAETLNVSARADTLAVLTPLLRWVRSQAGDSGAASGRMDGEGRLSLTVTGTVADWSAEGKLELASVEVDDYRASGVLVEGTLGRGVAGVAGVAGAGGARVRLAIAADSVGSGALRASAVRATVEGTSDSVAVQATVGLPLGTVLRSSLVAWRHEGATAVRVDSAEVALPSGTWALERPALVTVTAESVTVDTLRLRSTAVGRIVATGSLAKRAGGDFRLTADSVPLADVYVLTQRDTTGIGGWVSVAARLRGAAANPAIEGYLGLAEGRFGDFRTPLMDGLFHYADRMLTFKGALWGGEVRVVGASGALPIDLALTAVSRRRLPGPLEIRFQADSADLAVVDRLTSLVSRVRGSLSADVTVRGTWDQPVVAGQARVTGGALTLAPLAQRWEGIELRLEMTGNRVHVAEGTIHSGGTLAVTGDVVLEDLTRPVLQLGLELNGFHAIDRHDLAGVTGTGRLRLEGPFFGATLSGSLTVDDGYLAFADLVEKRIVNLDDPEFRAVVDSSLARASEIGPSFSNVFLDSLRIDNLRVIMGRSVWLRSSEANIQLAGDFTVSKTPANVLNPYRLDGTLQTVRGTYRLVIEPTSKDFQVTRGEVRFFGTSDLNPQLDIAAEHTVRTVSGADVVVRARIGGTLHEPRLSLESDQRPPLSQTELVSYLLFGRPSFELGATVAGAGSEQAMWQGAATLLAGRLAGQLEQTLVAGLGLPLDYLAIRPGSSAGSLVGSARVEAGTRIGERTFLTVNAGICEARRGAATGLVGASIEYRFTRRWRVEASIEPLQQECRGLGTMPRPSAPYQIGVDLFWQRGLY